MRRIIYVLLTVLLFVGVGCRDAESNVQQPVAASQIVKGNTEEEPVSMETDIIYHLNTSNTVHDVVQHPQFDGFGDFILPLGRKNDEGMPLSQVASLLPYHSNINAQFAVDTINSMIDGISESRISFYSIYEDEKMQEHTGLFFFRGEPGQPFAIVCAGGGFSYVGSIHEGFPLALHLADQGYNAFVIQYRTGGADVACEDLAAAISFIFSNAEELSVDTGHYSLWGGSAGARMAAYLGSYGSAAFGGNDHPRPSAVIMQYTGHSDYTENDPPTFAVIGENDGIASWRTMEQRIGALKAAGINAEFHKYPNLGHGFGLGLGTSAEGWADDAITFWETQINK